MARDLKLQVILNAVDRATGPLKRITQGSGATAQALKASRDQLKELEKAQQNLRGLRDIRRKTEETNRALVDQQREFRELTERIELAGGATRDMNRQRDAALRKIRALKEQSAQQAEQAQRLKNQLRDVHGITGKLAGTEDSLANKIRTTNDQLKRQQDELEAVARKQRRLADAKNRYQRSLGQARNIAGAGAMGVATGGAALYGGARMLAPSIGFEAQIRDMAITGEMGKAQEEALAASVRANAKRWNRATEEINAGLNVLVANGMTDDKELQKYGGVIAKTSVATGANDEDIGALLYSLKENLNIDANDSQSTLDAMAYSGKQGSFELRDMAKWVPQLGPMMETLGSGGKEGAAELTSALQIARRGAGTNDEAANNLRNYLAKITSPDAIKKFGDAGIDLKSQLLELRTQGISPLEGSLQIIQEYMGKKSPQAMAKFKEALAIDDDGERQAALEKLSSAFALGDLFVDQQAMAFIRPALANMEDFKKIQQESLKATGVIDADWEKRMETSDQQVKRFKIAMQDLGLVVGASVLPMLNDMIESLVPVLHALGTWAEANPGLVRTIVMLGAGIAGLVAIGGSLMLMLGSVLGPIAMVRYALTLLSLNPASLTIMAIVAACAALAGAAYLIYRNWDSISGWFGERWQQVKAAFSDGIGAVARLLLDWSPIGLIWRGITAGLELLGVQVPASMSTLGTAIIDGLIGGIAEKFGALRESVEGMGDSVINWFKEKLGINSPSRIFVEFGGFLIEGLVNGIKEKWQALKSKIGETADAVVGWFKEKLGIHSPSRVFAELGGYTMAGYQQGLSRNESGPLRQLDAFTQRLRQAGAGLALGVATLPSVATADIPIDARPPLSAYSGGGISITMGDIVVNSSSGMDEQALARYVAAEVQRALERAAREQAALQRSAFYDID